MITYYLQHGPDGRRFIHEDIMRDSLGATPVQARTWIEAKYKLGYALTRIQEAMLDTIDAG